MGNFCTSLLRAYKLIKGYNIVVNKSRLYNSYSAILDLMYISSNYIIFWKTNQRIIIFVMTGVGLIKIISDFIVQIKPQMRFMYSIILVSVALITIFILLIIITVRIVNIHKICNLVSQYYIKYNGEINSIENSCKYQKKLYYIWIATQLIFCLLGGIEIKFDYDAHQYLKKKKKKKKKN